MLTPPVCAQAIAAGVNVASVLMTMSDALHETDFLFIICSRYYALYDFYISFPLSISPARNATPSRLWISQWKTHARLR